MLALVPAFGVAAQQAEPVAPIPVLTDADRAAAVPAAHGHAARDEAIYSYSLLNRVEGWDAHGGTGFAWEGDGWIGRDVNRLWWRTDGERVDGSTESANAELLFGHSFTPWWDWVAGVRQDFRPGDSRTFAALGVQGLAPQRFEVALTLYAGGGGQSALRFETRYQILLTNRLVLQPLLEFDAYGKDDASRGIGAGLSGIEAGLRLRYEISRRFAPYLGINLERALGDTADLRRAAGGDVRDTRLVAGLRIWF
jgi:copper resistance protein B